MYNVFSRFTYFGKIFWLGVLLFCPSYGTASPPNPAGPVGPQTVIGFHWGDVNGNANLLTQGGLPSQGAHANDLHRGGGSALVNDAVLQQARTWYEQSGRRDAAGAGFYFSTGLFDSRGFGNDLLIVEITSTDPNLGIPITQMSGLEIRELSDRWADAQRGANGGGTQIRQRRHQHLH